MSAKEDLKCLDDLNNTLDNIVTFIDNSFSNLEDLNDESPSVIQKEIDKICEKISIKGTDKLNNIRDNVVDVLHNKYASANEVISTLQPIVEAKIEDLGAVISVLTKIIEIYTKPYSNAVKYIAEFTTEVTPKLLDITDKLAYIYLMKDNISVPMNTNVNFDKLNITMKPITIDDIIQGRDETKIET